jgi:curli biogenesis system outer membrane secretion channel CsgG
MTSTGWVKASFVLAACMIAFPAHIQAQGRIKVAIYPFDQSTVQANIQKEIGGNINYGQVASDSLVAELTQQADVVNRDQMKRILEEQGRRYDENFDRSQTNEVGKLLGVDAIITGSITSLSAEQQTGGGVSKIIGTFHKSAPKMDDNSTTVKVQVEVFVEAISTVTGKTVASAKGVGVIKKTTASKLTVNNQTSGNNTGSKSGFDPYVRDALAAAVKNAAGQLSAMNSVPAAASSTAAAPAPAKPAESAAPEYVALPDEVGNVAKVTGDSLVFFLAPGAHVAVGDVLEVQSAEITKNPRTGKQTAIGDTLGTLQVQNVSGDQARGKYTGKAATDKDRVVKKASSK